MPILKTAFLGALPRFCMRTFAVLPLRRPQAHAHGRGVACCAAHAGGADTPPDGHKWRGINARPGGKYIARIKVAGEEVRSGPFTSAAEAARWYDKAAVRLGRFDSLNFPKGDYYDGNGQLLPEPELDARLRGNDPDNPRPQQPTYGGKPQSSKYHGVSRHGSGFQVMIVGANGERVNLGIFGPDEEEEAARTYDKAALRAKERPHLNFPQEDYYDAKGQLLPEPRIDAILRGDRDDPALQNVSKAGKPMNKTSRSFVGVSWQPRATGTTLRPWRAQIKAKQTNANLGTYASEEEAARVYDKAAVRLKPHDDKLKLNFPLSDYVDSNGHLLPEPDIDDMLKRKGLAPNSQE